MNIDNSLGMTLFSNDISSTTSAMGNLNGLSKVTGQSPEGSLFQQLISQMLMAKNGVNETAEVGINGEEQNQSGGTGDVFSELLLAGGNLAKIRFMDSENGIDESAEANELLMEANGLPMEAPANENNGPMDSIQALMAGFANPIQTANNETTPLEAQAVKGSVEAAVSEIGSLQTAGSELEVQENRKTIPNNITPQDSLEMTTAVTDGKTAETDGMTTAKDGTLALEEGNTVQQSAKTAQTNETVLGSSEKSASKENDLPTVVKTEPEMIEKPETMTGQDFKNSEIGRHKQTAAGENPMQEVIADAAKTAKSETEADGINLERNGFQNSIHGAVSTRGAAEASRLTQPVETNQPFSQIRAEILTKLEQNGPTEFKMQLDPEDLGQIDIKLKLSDGKLIIDILAANSKTMALLTGQVDKLIASMGLQNVVVESVHVNQQMNSQTQDNSQSQGFTMNSAMDFSQRKQQEQAQQQILNDSRLAGSLNRQDETQASTQANRIEAMRYDTHRMNYAV